MTRIFKFGGASVRDASSIRNLSHILKIENFTKGVIVLSAMGKTTVALEKLAALAFKNVNYNNPLAELFEYHEAIQRELRVTSKRYEIYKSQLIDGLQNSHTEWYSYLDRILPFGELFSTSIVSEFLAKTTDIQWLDAREMIVTDSSYGEARVNWSETKHRIKRTVDTSKICLTQGYIGRSEDGIPVTLGKEGSDYTASILANCLEAEQVTVWKDVPGILNADPKLMEETNLFDRLSYHEITEMTYYGAKVIHPKTISPLAKKEIPLFVRSFVNPKETGTLIEAGDASKIQLPTFIFKFNELVVTVRPRNNEFMDEIKLMKIFQVLHENNVKINLMQNSALTFTFCFDYHEAKLEAIKKALTGDFMFRFNDELHLATIKNHNEDSIKKLPKTNKIYIEQKSRSVYHRLYRV